MGLPTIIGAGAGLLGGLFGGGSSSTTTTPDATTQAARDAIFGQAQGIQNNPLYRNLLASYGGAAPLTQLGLGALGGDQQAFGQFMNPYLQNVLAKSNDQFAHLGAQAQNMVNDQATRAGAFGGSRAAIAQGVAAGQVANQQALTNSQLLYGGFNDAQQRAAQAAQIGFAGNQGALGALQFPASMYQMAEAGGGGTETKGNGGGGIGGAIAGALGGAITGNQLFGHPQAAAAATASQPGYIAPYSTYLQSHPLSRIGVPAPAFMGQYGGNGF